jgi:hypothetical protein
MRVPVFVYPVAGFAVTVGEWRSAGWALWADLDDALDGLAGVYFLDLVFAAAIGVVWLVWFRRVRGNAEVFAPGEHRHGTGMAVGGWFIPVGCWIIPGRIARDTWFASLPPEHRGRPGDRATTPGLPWPGRTLLGWWWAACVSASILMTALLLVLGGIAGAADRETGVINFDQMSALTGWAIVIHLLCVPMAALSIAVVHRLTALQARRAHRG